MCGQNYAIKKPLIWLLLACQSGKNQLPFSKLRSTYETLLFRWCLLFVAAYCFGRIGLSLRGYFRPTATHKLADGTDYYKINPLGYVPLLVLDDGRQLREGPAIVQYIADQVPDKHLAPANGTFERSKLQEWLTFIGTELHKGFSPLFNPATPAEYKTIATTKLMERLKFTDGLLAGQDYVMGSAY